MKTSCLVPAIGLSILVLCIVAALVGYFLFREPREMPSVLISSPRNGERLGGGEETVVRAVARGDAERKIKRVELWVDGKLTDAQTSNLPGGISPFPLVVSWRPPTPGAHTLTVRAFDTTNARGQASISVETLSSADRDYDDVPDATDACPDQPGPAANRGCPAPSAGDRDGDGIADANDACPDQPGTTLAQGCPDADGDSIRDSADACPSQYGVAAGNGCPSPTDTDSDGIANASDRCPSEAGPAETGGCPGTEEATDRDRDGDGVMVPQDLCPDVPGPATNAGCPPTGTGDSDRDGVDDGTDLAPTEAGSADSGGAPPPGGGADEDHDDVADDEEPESGADEVFPDMGGSETVWLVRIDALEFSVTQDYEEVYCYVQSQGIAERFGPFELIGTRHWNIAEFVGGSNSRTIPVRDTNSLRLHIECSGHYPSEGLFSIAPADLGSITRAYVRDQWDGHVITERSGDTVEERGTAGHLFEVKFRLCLRSCESSTFPPPVLSKRMVRVGPLPPREYLAWDWSGDEHDITGYKLYVNGNRRARISADRRNRVRLSLYDPPCGETYEYYVVAYKARADGFNDRESPPSNVVTADGEECPRRVRVTFTEMFIGSNVPDDFGANGGPFYGSFWATGIREQKLEWRSGECHSFLWVYDCRAYEYAVDGNIAVLFAGIRATGPELSGWNMYAPEVNYVIVELEQNDDLTVGVHVMDEDVYLHDDTMLDLRRTITAPFGTPADMTLRSGNRFVILRIEEAMPANSALSDRNVKSNVSPVNPRDVLARLAQVPVSTWNYTSDGTAARHIGVMAQDFYAAFGVGETDTRIMQVDADGVAFAAIQGLYQMVREKDVEIQSLKAQNAKSQSEISSMEARVAALEQRTGNQPNTAQPLPLPAVLAWLVVGAAIGIGFARAKRWF
jgi:hypothetical protein